MDYENDTTWVRGILHPGENLLWSGKPGKGHLFSKEDAMRLPFGIIWCGFAIFWEITALRDENAPFIFKLWGIPFILVGLFTTVGHFFVKKHRAKRSSYALTSQRIISKLGNQIQTLELCNLPHISVNQRADGTGDIRFGEVVTNRRYASTVNNNVDGFSSTRAVLEFQNIPDVNQVEYRIRTAVEQALAARRSED